MMEQGIDSPPPLEAYSPFFYLFGIQSPEALFALSTWTLS